jgi:uncharacterized membrane protein (DUF485 family)
MSVTSPHRPAPPRAATPPAGSAALTDGLRRTAGSTPGRLGLAMVGLVVLSLLTGVIGLLTVQGKASTLNDLTTRREPFSAAAQQMYRSLSDADATMAGAFLTSAVTTPALRERYQTDIQQAGAALAVAATDVEGVTEAAKPLAQLSTGIPVYTGLVERASTNNAQGFPIGSAYLREADHLMQANLLPAAQALYAVDTQRVEQAQDDATSFPWAAAVLVIVLLVALIVTQRFVRRRTNRVINVGLLVATVAVVVAVLWSATGLVLETVHVAHARSAGSAPADSLAQARTKALQARTDEMLTLVARGGQDYNQPFVTLTAAIGGKDGSGGLLGQVRGGSSDSVLNGQVDQASTAAKSWFALHDQARSANQAGDYPTAVSITLGTAGAGRPDEATQFDKVDNALAKAINQARTVFADQTGTAGAWLTALPVGVLVLLVLAAAGAAIGLWQRLKEYR